MRLSRKVLALGLTGCMLLSAAGCGKSQEQKETGTSSSDTVQKNESTAEQNSQTGQSETENSETENSVSERKEPVKLRLWAHWGSEQRRPSIDKIISQFNELYKDEQIEAEYVYVPFDDIERKNVTAVTAGNPGNVVITAIEEVAAKAMRNQASNITPYLSEGIEQEFYPQYWDMVKWNDEIYALPFATDTRLVFYNKEMFEEAGVKAEELTSWDAMLEACKKLDDTFMGKDDNYILAFNPMLGNFGFTTLLYNNGGGTWDDPINPQVPTVNSKECIETLSHMKVYSDMYGADLVQAAFAANAGGAQDLFLSGKVAMIGQVCNYIETIRKYNGEAQVDYGVFAYPAGPSSKTGEPAAWGGGFVCTVPYGASNLQESVLLAEYMAAEGSKVWAVEQKTMMCSIKANENPAMADYVGWNEAVALMDSTQITRHNIYVPGAGSSVDNAVNKICKDFTSNDVEGVLNEAQKEVEVKLEEEKFIFGE